MIPGMVEKAFKKSVCENIRLHGEGNSRFRVFTPFRFDDGDHLSIILKNSKGKWMLSDEGNTFMHLTYDLDEKDLLKGTRNEIIESALASYSVSNKEGELILGIEDEHYGDALYSYIQALMRISNVTFLSRERARSTFIEDFRAFIIEKVPENRRTFDWYDTSHDPEGIYPVDCKINGMPRPLFIFALPGDDKTRDATINIYKYEQWNLKYRVLGIFENQEEVNRKVLARFSDVCEKQFSALNTNKDRLQKYFSDAMSGG